MKIERYEMLEIEHKESIEEELCEIIDTEFNKYAIKNDLICNYKPFSFVARENDEVVGILKGNSMYKEVYIGELIVVEQYRNKDIGSELIKAVENYYKDKGFENMNLNTYSFQAPEFYKKCGFKVEYIRENKENPKLNKYFLVKYF